MTGIDSYSTTPLTNSTCDGGSVNWAENQPPSTVNNSARQVLADVRSAFNDAAWFQYGTGDQGAGNIAVPSVYASSTSFTIAGVDVTAAYHAGRRVRAVGSTTGTIYGSIASSSFSTNTTVNVTWDSGSLSNETLVISLSQIPVTGSPVKKLNSPILTTPSVTGLLDASAADAGQIKFPAAQNASTNANTLDDYEEGTFTPSLQFGGAAVGMTFTTQVAEYVKIGQLVHFSLAIVLSAKGSSSGAATVTGLPFTASNAIAFGKPCSVRYGLIDLTTASGYSQVTAMVDPNATTITLEQCGDNVGADLITNGLFSNTSSLLITGTYRASA